jgi:hypothetical protein
MEKLEFMSPAWINMAEAQITEALKDADLGRIRFTLCEEFTDPPSELRRNDATTIGFCVRIIDGDIEVGDSPADDADLRIVSRFDDAHEVARDPDAPAAQPEAMQQRIREGTLQILGDPADAPAALTRLDIHRLLASRTA